MVNTLKSVRQERGRVKTNAKMTILLKIVKDIIVHLCTISFSIFVDNMIAQLSIQAGSAADASPKSMSKLNAKMQLSASITSLDSKMFSNKNQ
jgi:hypothetical protein